MSLLLLVTYLWVIIVAIRLITTHECQESSPHIWGLLFVVVCVQVSMLFVVALFWLVLVIRLLL